MKRPFWFKRHTLNWTPCTWQGWLIVAALTGFLAFFALRYAPTSPGLVVVGALCAVALVVGIAVYTDDTHQRSE